MHTRNRKQFVFKGIGFVIVLAAVVSLILFLLWNWLMPTIFGLPVINYWQALGLLLLSKILFSGFHKRGRPPHMDRDYWKMRFDERHFSPGDKSETETV